MPMSRVRRALRFAFERLEALLGLAFPPAWNPLYHLGALGFFFTGSSRSAASTLRLFDTGVTAAYGSVEDLTRVSGIRRGDAQPAPLRLGCLVLTMVVHIVREWSPRSLSRAALVHLGDRGADPLARDLPGSPATGWSGTARPVRRADHRVARPAGDLRPVDRPQLPLPGQPERPLLHPAVFMHIASPLILLLVLWIHLQRVSRPKINPARGLAVGTFVAMLLLSLIRPAVSQGPADLAIVPAVVGLDWFYLGFYPLLESWPGALQLGPVGALDPDPDRPTLAAAAQARAGRAGRPRQLQRLHALRQRLPLQRDHHAAADRRPRVRARGGGRSGALRQLRHLRRRLPDLDAVPARERRWCQASICRACRWRRCATRCAARGRPVGLAADHGLGCDHGVQVARPRRPIRRDQPRLHRPIAACVHRLRAEPRSGRRRVAHRLRRGVCHNRFGIAWTEGRLAGVRDPHLRARVPRERLATSGPGCDEGHQLDRRSGVRRRARSSLVPKIERRLPLPSTTESRGRAMVSPPLSRPGCGLCALCGGLGTFATPGLHPLPTRRALIKLSLTHGARKEECRRRTPEELAKLPPNMRRPWSARERACR